MTDFQREILKERDKIYFHYEKSDVSIQMSEVEINNEIKEVLNINLEYIYYFDSSLINLNDVIQGIINKGIITDDYFKSGISKEDFEFKHEISFEIFLDELKKNEYLKDLNSDEIEEYIKAKIHSKFFKEMVFNIGLVEAISYYKIYPAKHFVVTGSLDEFQKQWWKKLFYKGLGEYRYLNSLLSIEEDKFLKIISNPKLDEYTMRDEDKLGYLNIENEGFLIPIGGGKDSVVSLELLRNFRNESTIYSIDHKGARVLTSEKAGFLENEVVKVERKFDDALGRRNEQGFFNGHIPFSAVLAFTSVLTAYILNKKYIPLSNESSANESTVPGMDINHQYSKSIEFETDFREYMDYLNSDIEYFSLLRPLNEVGIARLFVRYEKYFNAFNSCNVGSKGDVWHWCCDCSKCLFAFIILAPFLYKDKLIEIFGCDVFENENLVEDMFKLIGKRDAKPFECVGTQSETKFSLDELMRKLNVENIESGKLPILLEEYKKIYLKEIEKNKDYINLYYVYNNDNYVPSFLEDIIKKEIQGE